MPTATIQIVPDTWTRISAASPAGKITFQNNTRGTVWFVANSALPVVPPFGVKYDPGQGESDIALADIFPGGGTDLYAYALLAGPIFYSAA